MRPALPRRLVALLLSWCVPATSAWAAAPPVVVTGAAPLALPSVVPGLAAALGRAAPRAGGGAGLPVTWKVEGPDTVAGTVKAATDAPLGGSPPPPLEPCASPFWGGKRYTRTTGAPNVFVETVTVPPSVQAPYRLTIVNGDEAGGHRVSSARIDLNGVEILSPSDFNQQVGTLVRAVTLTPTTTLKVTLASAPGSYLTLSLCGKAAPDLTPPAIAVAEPPAGALLGVATPLLRVTYSDAPGAGGTASGVDTSTLVVTLDGQDRTAWFTRGPAEATAEVPVDAVLGEGGHRIEARIRDLAGNEGVATPVEFRVDSLPPSVAITQPQDGTFTSAATVDVSGTVADASPIVRLRVNGQDAMLAGASFTAPGVPISDGPEVTIEAEAEDAAGHVGRATVLLRVDRRSPTVTITRPADGDNVQGPVLEVEGTVDDDSDVRVDVNGTPEDAPAALRAPRGFRAHVPITDGTTTLTATARDAAGNTGTTFVTVRTDTLPPTIVIHEPGPDVVTKQSSIHVTGTATDASGIASVSVDGQPALVAADGAFEADVPLGGEGTQTIVAVATDTAGNAASTSAVVTIDRTAPVFTLASPDAGAQLGTLPVLVQGTVEDPHLAGVTVDGVAATVTGLAWQAAVAGLGDGPHTLTAIARDRAGNEATLTREVTLDTGYPVVTISAPADGTLLRDAAVAVSGTVRDATLQSLRVGGQAVAWSGDPAAPEGATFVVPALPLAEGQNAIEAVAQDALARQGTASVQVVRDSLPPTLELVAPSLVVRGHSEKAVASPNDGSGSGVASVEFLIDDQPAGTLGSPPFELPLEPPPALASGDSFTVSARATDLAGNVSATVSRTVAVVSEGMVVGQVLSDETSLPLAGATVRLVGVAVAPSTTDARGRYALPVQAASALVIAEAADHTSVERELPVAVGTGTVPVDARLSALAPPASIGPAGGALHVDVPAARLEVAIPVDALAAAANVRLTPVSAQGLPGLLPLGWSPLLTFDLRTDGAALAGPLAATVSARDASGAPATSFSGWPSGPVFLAEYQPTLHAWVLVEAGLAPAAGELTASLPGPGAFALVVPDTGDVAPPIPAVGEALGGVPLAELPATAASRSVVEPSILPPSGGTAAGTLVVDSPLALPSGTVVQARVSETFSLASGETASEEERPMDIVLFRAPCTALAEAGGVSTTCPDAGPAAIAARVPLTPSRSFGTSELVEGKVHLDILAGRESARGTTGGTAPVVVSAGEARLAVPGTALAKDTAIALRQAEALSSFLPPDAGIEAVAEVVVDLAGAVLALPAELSVPFTGADGTFVVARVERVDGVPRLAVVALAVRVGDRLVTQPSAILPGVTREGRHVFYRLSGPVGFVRGVTSTDAGGAKAVVTADALPFIAASEPNGAYVLTTLPAAAVTVRARIPATPFQAEGAPVEVTANEAVSLNLLLSGAATTARVTPPSGSAGIAVNVRIEVVPTVPLDAASLGTAVVRLVRASDSQPVPLRLVVGVGGRSLSVIPERKVGDEFVPLEYATAYTLTATGLKDSFGKDVTVPPSTFTTQAFTPPVLDAGRLVFDLPDENGIVKVHAPVASFPPGTTILIVNSGNGVVLSLTADNDGAVDGELPASASDRLLVTITDPQGNAKTFERSQYLIDAATGETAVGPGGGVVTSPDAPGFELRVPKDATDQAVRLKIKALSLADFSELPALPEAEFGAALEVTAPERPTFKKEVDLAFPLSSLPALPADAKPEEAYYAVVRELTAPGGEKYFQTIDDARVECPEGQASCDAADKKVVTASFPFPGLVTTFGGLTASFGLLALETARYLLMRTYNAAFRGKSQWGAITGRVLQPVPVVGKPGQYEYKGVSGCSVRRAELMQPNETLAESQPAGEGLELGRFTFNAPWFTGGTVLLAATCGERTYTGTAYVIAGGAVEVTDDDGVKRLLGSGVYQTVGFVNITLPVAAEPVTAPRVEIRIFKEEADGTRSDLKGATVTGTPFQVGVRAPGYVVRDVKIRDESKTILVPDPLKNTKPKDPLAFDAILQDAYTPGGAGSYVIEATAMDPAALTTVTGETVVQVLATPGGATVSVPGRPGVIAPRTVPRDTARGVSVSVLPQLSFTEPVKNVGATSVTLVPVGCAPPPEGSTATEPTCTDSTNTEANPGEAVPLRILAVTPDNQTIDITGAEATPPFVVSLMLQPLVSLSFGTMYRLELRSTIVDQDGEPLVGYTSRFSTFLPEEVGQSNETDKPTVTGLVVLGDRGYVLETLHAGGVAGPQQASVLRVYDVTDPVEPKDLTDPATGTITREVIAFPPRDIAGEEVKADDGSPTGERLIAIATAPRTFYQVQGGDPFWTELKSTPSNLLLYDVSNPDEKPRFAGAANISNNLVDGIPNRLFMQKGRIYAATFPKGIQVISTGNLRLGFPPDAEATGQDAIDIQKKLFAGGLNPGAIVLTIPVKDPGTGLSMPLNDLKAMDLQVWGVPRKVVAATGSRPQAGLVLGDAVSPYMETGETQPKPLWLGPLAKDGSSLEWGGAIALTKIGDVPHALVGGTGVIAGGGSQALLAIVDLSPVAPAPVAGEPRPSPKVVAIVPLPKLNGVGDILLIGNTAVVSGATGTRIDGEAGGAALVDFTNASAPEVVGYVKGAASRMAVDADGGILYSSHRSFVSGTPTELAGVKTATLDRITVITEAKEHPLMLAFDRTSIEPQHLKYRAIGVGEGVTSSVLELVRDGLVIRTIDAPLDENLRGTLEVPKGIQYAPSGYLRARLVVNRGSFEAPRPKERLLRGEPFIVQPTEPATVQAWGEPVDILAFNKAIMGRLQQPRALQYQSPLLSWVRVGAPNATVAPLSEAPKSGIYVTELSSTGQAGSVHWLELRQNAAVLGHTAPMTVIPGPAVDAVLSANRAGDPIPVPADGTTVLNLTLESVEDASGNPVANGTPVSWRVVGDGGDLFDVDASLAGGRATARYRVGIEPEPEPITIVAEVDGVVRTLSVKQEELETSLTADGAFIDLVVSSPAGIPADRTRVSWSTLHGEVQDADELVNGRARGRWVPFNRPGEPKYDTIDVFSSVGRSRGSTQLKRFDVEPAPAGLRLRLDTDRLMGDRTTSYTTREGPNGLSLPAQTTVRVAGATPGVPVSIFLGSPRFPAYEPIAAYGFDVAVPPPPNRPDDPDTTPDLYGHTQVNLGSSIDIDDSQQWYGAGSLRFAVGAAGATISDLPALLSDFGFSGFVEFDAPSAGQKVLEKTGSYSVAVVDEGGAPRLEFAIVSGGIPRRVLSTQALAQATWYHFAAHFRGGRLILQVGDSEPIQEADVGGAADASAAPLTLGVDFEGRLDALQVFDFTRAPLFTFDNGQTVTQVTPDATGQAQAQLVSTGVFYAPSGYEAVGPPGQMWLGIGQDYRLIVAEAQFRAWTERQLTTGCWDALKTGEPDTALGFVCELGAGFIPGVNVAQGVRDFYFAAKRFSQSKRTKKDYILATVGIGLAVVVIIPGAKAVKSLAKAKAVVEVSETAGKLVAKELEKQTEKAVVGETADYVAEKSVLSLFEEGAAPATREAAVQLAESFKNPQAAREALDRLAATFGPEALVTTLNRFRAKFSDELVERLVIALDKMPQLASAGKVSEEALEGMLVFLRKTNADARLEEIWSLIRGVDGLSPADHLGVLKRTFELIRDAEAAGARDLGKVLDQLKNKGLGLETFKGALNHLDEAAAVGWSKIISMDRARPGYFGRPDLLVQDGLRLLEIELKNLGKGAQKLSSADYQQLAGKIKAAIDRATDAQGVVSRRQLAIELGNIQYRIRGLENVDYGLLFRQDFYKTAGDWLTLELGEGFRGLEANIGLLFSGRRLPF